MNISDIPLVEAKLANMRKPQSFIVYPASTTSDQVIVQSEKSIGRFDPKTGVGVLNTKGCYFHHLHTHTAEHFVFPKEFVEACLKAQTPANETIVVL